MQRARRFLECAEPYVNLRGAARTRGPLAALTVAGAVSGWAEAQQQAATQAEQREQATSEQMANFKKAFSVCLEAKNYMVKY